ncbi:hypothetical protein [Pseudonocardia acaciae]|uniref:hypothetical protein n=1 Tax=Pseudonocardia acaciae TaxID=551276 RepID=UPI00048B3C5E|nr:hypothetical protein [Pseudonocardia acaciae]
MELVPDHRALLRMDVVRSASNRGYHLTAVSDAVTTMTDDALRSMGAESDVLKRDFIGDGELLTFPGRRLGSLFDMADRLNQLVEGYNRWRKPEIKLRVAVEIGPIGGGRQLTTPMISLARMIDAEAFKKLFQQCLNRGRSLTHAGLICSDHAYRVAFGGERTRYVRQDEFTSILLKNKEYQATAWVRIPGFDAESLSRLLCNPESSSSAKRSDPVNPIASPTRSAPVVYVEGDSKGNVVAERVDAPFTIDNRQR